jgi:putative inorganic carbon (hco3(-)) transporter
MASNLIAKTNLPIASSQQRLIRLLLVGLMLYLSTLGATFNGVFGIPALQPVTLGALGLVAALWLAWRWRTERAWHHSALDGVFIVWMIAFVISILANGDTWRRNAEALWYMALYIGVWYIITDLLAQGLRRAIFGEVLLVTGIIIIPIGYGHLFNLIVEGMYPQNRPTSIIGNANALGAYLVVLLPFALAVVFTAQRRLARYALGGYALLTFALLLATYSRGAWIGMAAGLVVFGGLTLHQYDLLSFPRFRAWLAQQSAMRRVLFAGAGLILLVGVLGGTLIFIRSFSAGGRQADLRTYLWQAALTLFTEKPLTGYGLFTYGHYLPRFDAIPPGQPHSHAHNIPLTVAAELGIPGIIVLLLTIGVVLWSIRRNLRDMPPRDKTVWIASVAAVFGFGTHHLLDTPAMMPLIALLGIMVLALAMFPAQPVPVAARWRQIAQPVSMVSLWLGLLLIGFWNASNYQTYYAALQNVFDIENPQASDYRAAAEQLNTVIAADPNQPAYLLQQAYLYGLAAHEGDLEAATLGSAVYDRYLALEPYHSLAWANRAALDWQLGDQDKALDAIDHALALAPEWTDYERQRAIYAGELTNAPSKKPEESIWAVNWAYFQYLRAVNATQYLPQVGSGN